MTYTERDRERWVAEDPAHKRVDRDDFARDRARLLHSSACAGSPRRPRSSSRAATTSCATGSPTPSRWPRSAASSARPRLQPRRRRHRLPRPRPRPPAVRAQRRVRRSTRSPPASAASRATPRPCACSPGSSPRSHPDGRPAGLNLTRASLDAATKYPWRRGERASPHREVRRLRRRRRDLRLVPRGRPGGRRSVEAEVMDLADDIAYSVHDVEDAIVAGWLDPRRLRRPRPRRGRARRRGRGLRARPHPDELGAALDRCWPPDRSRDLRRLPSRPRGAQGHDQPAHRPVRRREEATRRQHGPGPLTRYHGDLVVPRRHPRRDAPCSRRSPPTSSCRRRAPAHLRPPARGVAALVAAYEGDPRPR